MAVLAVLIGLGVFVITSNKKEEPMAAPAPEPKKEEVAEVSQRREGEKTGERPLKKEMKVLSLEKKDDLGAQIGKWVIVEGRVEKGTKDGDLSFQNDSDLSAYLLRGGAGHLDGRFVRIIGWVLDEKTLQIDGLEDIEAVAEVDLLPKKDVYTEADYEQLNALRGTSVTFEGKVAQARKSGDGKSLYLVFESKNGEIYGTGEIEKLKKEGITEEVLNEMVGKKLRLKGKLDRKEVESGFRVTIAFSEKKDYELIE